MHLKIDDTKVKIASDSTFMYGHLIKKGVAWVATLFSPSKNTSKKKKEEKVEGHREKKFKTRLKAAPSVRKNI